MVAEDDTAFSQEASESLVSKANLSGRGFEGPAGSVGGFRSLEEVFGCSRRLLWLASPAVCPVPSARIDWCSRTIWRMAGASFDKSPARSTT